MQVTYLLHFDVNSQLVIFFSSEPHKMNEWILVTSGFTARLPVKKLHQHKFKATTTRLSGLGPDSSPIISKLSLLINYLLGKRLDYARGEDGKVRGVTLLPSSFPSSPSLKSPF